ncbi:MAG: pilus assembly PilX N-terminal domain-containing protein [Bacillota bacterium]|nr:pilus assembly PilX N-terminal domain-containing protein [Bacillota bacterium]
MRLLSCLGDNRGQAMLALVSILAVIMLLGTAAVTLAAGAKTEATAEENRAKALYIAEAGVEMALDYLQNDLLYYDRQYLKDKFPRFVRTNEEYQEGLIEEVKIQWSGQGDDYLITSRARYPKEGAMQAFRKVTVKIRVQENAFLTYGGPGIKSDRSVNFFGGVSSNGGSIVARTGDVTLVGLLQGTGGGIYAGRDVQWTALVGSSGQGEIKAGNDVNISGVLSAWTGTIWAGGNVDRFHLPLGQVEVHDQCGSNIPGFPIPEFPVVDKNSAWYEAVKSAAQDQGQYYTSCNNFYTKHCEINKGIPILGILSSATLTIPPGITVVEGTLYLSGQGFYDAGYQPGLLGSLLSTPKIICAQSSTVVADRIVFDAGLLPLLGLGIDVSGIKAPLGLFAVNGGVSYNALVGSGGTLCVMANGTFIYGTLASGSTFDWVAAKQDVNVSGLITLNFAQDTIPPGTPVGYEIISWKEE